jgi:GT2 family glycosyltransferase
MADTAPQATVLIVTKNRKDDLRRALASTFAQTGASIEVIVFDDGSTDGTAEVVRAEFHQVQLHWVEKSVGYIVHRNRGTELAKAPVVVVIDDDSAFEAPDTVATTLRDFADDPGIGAVAIPFINQGQDHVTQCAPDEKEVWVAHKFVGAAHALRKDAFAAIGGYRTELVHFGEEADLCARLLQAGFVTRLGRATPARHYLSPIRNRTWERYYAARAGIVTSYMNLPAVLVPPALAGWTARELMLIARHGGPGATVRGIAGGYRDIVRFAGKRRPLSWPVYKTLRELRKRGPMTLAQVRERLPGIVRP